MKTLYTEAALYAYPKLNHEINMCDRYVMSKALASVYNYQTPCEEQCQQIVFMMERKKQLIQLKIMIEEVMKTLRQHSVGYLYEYYFEKVYTTSYLRSHCFYVKHQDRLVQAVTSRMMMLGADDEWFEKTLFKMNFMRYCLNKAKKKREPKPKLKPRGRHVKQED